MIGHTHVASVRDRQSLSIEQDHETWMVTGLPCFLCDERYAPLASIAVAPRNDHGEHPETLF